MCSIELITMFARIVPTMNIWKETNAKVLKRKKKNLKELYMYISKSQFIIPTL